MTTKRNVLIKEAIELAVKHLNVSRATAAEKLNLMTTPMIEHFVECTRSWEV